MSSAVKTNYAKWRAISLTMVYLLMGLHIAHWKLAGKTLAPLEFNEVLYTIHLGLITAGFIFMLVTVVATLVAGRFFCSWMCHIVALQDGCAWLLQKLHIRVKHIRSRTLLWVPFATVIYLFVLPQIERLISGQPAVALHMAKDSNGWASFMTSNYWRNLPSVEITLLTFFICGGLIVYVLGSRSFCQYACPYGMLFSLADRVAPGKIKLTGDCTQCGKCTAVCSSHIQVQREVNQFNRVVDPNCLKDMDCVQVCPEDALSFGFTKPSGFLSYKNLDGYKRKFDFSLTEDIFLGVNTFVFVAIFRGLYDTIPFLLSIAIGILISFGFITFIRLWKKDFVRLGHFVLKRPIGITRQGKIFSAFMTLMLIFSIHSAVVHYNTFLGDRYYSQLAQIQASQLMQQKELTNSLLVSKAYSRLKIADRLGLLQPPSLLRELAALSIIKNDQPAAALYLQRMLVKLPGDLEGRLKYAKLLVEQQKTDEAAVQLKQVIGSEAQTDRDKQIRADASFALGRLREKAGLKSEAVSYYEKALEDEPGNFEVKLALGILYSHIGRFDDAEKLLLETSVGLGNSAIVENNLAVIYLQQKKYVKAEQHFNIANRMQPGNAQVMYNLAMLQLAGGREKDAFEAMKSLLVLHPDHKNARAALLMMERKLHL